MPNWTTNHVTAPADVIKKYISKNEEEGLIYDFNKLIPMPEALHVEAGSQNYSDIYIYLSDKFQKPATEVAKSPYAHLVMGNFFPTPVGEIERRAREVNDVDEAYARGKVLVDNYQKYGATTWYDWCSAHWGTKWNACGTCYESGSDEVSFDTAWSMPEGIARKLFHDNPDANIVWTWYDEDYNGVWQVTDETLSPERIESDLDEEYAEEEDF